MAAFVAVTGSTVIGGRAGAFDQKSETRSFLPGVCTADHRSRPVFSVGEWLIGEIFVVRVWKSGENGCCIGSNTLL